MLGILDLLPVRIDYRGKAIGIGRTTGMILTIKNRNNGWLIRGYHGR
jgi:hypothetical protein